MNTALSRTRKIAYAAMFIGIFVIVNRLLGLVQPAPIFSFNRLGISTPLILFASVFLGPGYGAIVGVAGDAIGWLLLGSWTGPFNVFLSIFYALLGILPWLAHRFLGKVLEKKYSLVAFVATLSALFVGFLLVLWVSDWYDACFTRWTVEPLIGKSVITAVSALTFSLTVVGVIWLGRKTKIGLHMGEIAWLALIAEVVTVVLKPLAFYAYCWAFLGTDISTAWGVSYGLLVIIAIIFSFTDIFITIAFLRLAMRASRSREVRHEPR